jgi:hypothetical protein
MFLTAIHVLQNLYWEILVVYNEWSRVKRLCERNIHKQNEYYNRLISI